MTSTPTATLLDRAASFLAVPEGGTLTWILPDPEPGLRELRGLTLVHSFRPAVVALERLGLKAGPQWPAKAAGIVALTLPRQLEWACGLIARGFEALAPGGTLLVVAPNDLGGKRYASLLDTHFDLSWSDSKNHCRMAGVERPAELPAIVAQWRNDYRPRPVPGTDLQAIPGAFSWEHIDKGSALLVSVLPPLAGNVADFGAGWGYLAQQLLRQKKPPAQVDLYEADDNALAMARRNLEARPEGQLEEQKNTRFFWHDLLSEPCAQSYDTVVMNPPFHDLRNADADIGRGFILRAAGALKDGGALWMVANRHLPYEKTLQGAFKSCEEVAVKDGFKVLHAIK